jgi:hypothetical protein
MRKAFLEFLTAERTIPPGQLDRIRGLLRGAPEPIGSIAFSYGMITGGDIDAILDDQRTSHEPFGEIAIGKGLLTRDQVDRLLSVQQIRAAMETAEALALSGICTSEQVMVQLGRFLTQAHDAILCADD